MYRSYSSMYLHRTMQAHAAVLDSHAIAAVPDLLAKLAGLSQQQGKLMLTSIRWCCSVRCTIVDGTSHGAAQRLLAAQLPYCYIQQYAYSM